MSRQIQFRRGTADEHKNFTGAEGEITVDLTNKTLRVHDGVTAGGTMLAKKSEIPEIANADYVVESQLPTAENNYTWYRKYKSGWVEQGGISQSQNVTLPVAMSNNMYLIHLTGRSNVENNNVFVHGIREATNYGFITQCNVLNASGNSSAANESQKYWLVCGFSN